LRGNIHLTSSQAERLEVKRIMGCSSSSLGFLLDNLIGIGFLILFLLFLLDDTDLKTFTSWDGNSWVLAISNDEDVADSSAESCTVGVLDVTNIIRSWMLLDGLENTNSTNIVSTGKIDGGTVD